jgi:glycosyltransferase involved in cell wall biosynthesis
MILFFGEIRREKGPEVLRDAVTVYDGPPFTLVIAGKPTEVPDNFFEDLDTTTVDIVSRLEFVPETKVGKYFVAADAVVLPYRPVFGEERTSAVLQQATAAGRPVVVSDFGVLGQRVSEHNLGVVFDPNSPAALANALKRVVTSDKPLFDPDRTRRYAESCSYETLVDQFVDIYQLHSQLD